jgi:hypothetical protein
MTEKGKRVVKHGIIPGLVVTFVCLWIVALGLLLFRDGFLVELIT